jgi:hypothetical protein
MSRRLSMLKPIDEDGPFIDMLDGLCLIREVYRAEGRSSIKLEGAIESVIGREVQRGLGELEEFLRGETAD